MDKRVFLRGLAAGASVAAMSGAIRAAQAGPLRVGVRGGVDEEIWEVVTRVAREQGLQVKPDRKSTRLNSSHLVISYAVFCLKKKHCNLQPCYSMQGARTTGTLNQAHGNFK